MRYTLRMLSIKQIGKIKMKEQFISFKMFVNLNWLRWCHILSSTYVSTRERLQYVQYLGGARLESFHVTQKRKFEKFCRTRATKVRERFLIWNPLWIGQWNVNEGSVRDLATDKERRMEGLWKFGADFQATAGNEQEVHPEIEYRCFPCISSVETRWREHWGSTHRRWNVTSYWFHEQKWNEDWKRIEDAEIVMMFVRCNWMYGYGFSDHGALKLEWKQGDKWRIIPGGINGQRLCANVYSGPDSKMSLDVGC